MPLSNPTFRKKRRLPRIRGAVASIVFHVVIIFLAYITQAHVMPYLNVFAVPLLLPITAAAVAMYEGSTRGAVLGMFAGILCDISFLEPISRFMLLLTISGLVVGTLTDHVVARGFIPYLVISLIVLVTCAAVQIFVPLAFDGVAYEPLLKTALQQILMTLPFTIIVYPLSKFAARPQMKTL